jgi:hypothetical protein
MTALASGCANSGPANPTPPSDTASSPGLQHVDGTVTLRNGEALTVTPSSGATRSFTLGDPALANSVRAMQASGERARVFHRGPVAVQVRSQERPADALTTTGRVLDVTDTALRLKTSDGEQVIVIPPDARPAFDTEHLSEHEANGEPIIVYYRAGANGRREGLTYEDA